MNPAIEKARDAGLYVIALDTPPDPADTVDITFATDNFKAGELIGKWTAAQLDGEKATIAMLDLFNDKIVSVDYNRDQGFLTGMGIDTKDKKKNGDEDADRHLRRRRLRDRLQRADQRRRGRRPHRDGDLPDQEPRHQRRLHDQRAGRGRRVRAPCRRPAPRTACSSSPSTVAATAWSRSRTASSARPRSSTRVQMAELGVKAIKKIADGGEAPAPTDGLDFYDTGVHAGHRQAGRRRRSIDTTKGTELCWG